MNINELIKEEEKRQLETLTLIPSENYASKKVRNLLGSVFSNKYAEGYPGRRYYQGNKVVDELERECQQRAKDLFAVPHVNVQPLSGAAANLAIIWALRSSNEDVQLSQLLSSGGHLSMGQDVSVTGVVMKAEHYHLDGNGEIDWKELEEKARKLKPRIIWAGGTAYTKIFDWEKYEHLATEVGAYFVADISHIGGLVAGGAHSSPVPFADVVMTTTHKSLRGPRGAMIMVTEKGLVKDPDLAKKVDKAVFPGVQGGPHMEIVAALSEALNEAKSEAFSNYAKQIVLNAQALAESLKSSGFSLVGGGTENHMVWVDLSDRLTDGWAAAWALEGVGLVANRQTVPMEKRSPYYPSGLRLGTPAVTTRGMKEKEMKEIGRIIFQTLTETESLLSQKRFAAFGGEDKEEGQRLRKMFKEEIQKNEKLGNLSGLVKKLALDFAFV